MCKPASVLRTLILIALAASSAFAQFTPSQTTVVRGEYFQAVMNITPIASAANPVDVEITATGNNRNWETPWILVPPSSISPNGDRNVIENVRTYLANPYWLGQFTYVLKRGSSTLGSFTINVVGKPGDPTGPTTCTLVGAGPSTVSIGQAASFTATSPNCGNSVTNVRISVNGGAQTAPSFTPQSAGTYSIVVSADTSSGRVNAPAMTLTVPPAVTCTLTATGPTSGQVGQIVTFSAASPNCAGQISNLRMSVNGVQQGGLSFAAPAAGGYTIVLSADSPSGTISATIGFTATAVPVTCTLVASGPTSGQVGQIVTFSAASPNCAGQISNLRMSVNGVQQGGLSFAAPAAGGYTIVLSADSPSGTISASIGYNATAAQTNCTLVSNGPTSGPVNSSATFSGYSPNCPGQLSNFRITVNGVQQNSASFYFASAGYYTIVLSADSPSGRISALPFSYEVKQPEPPFNCVINTSYSGLAQKGQTITVNYQSSGCNLDGKPTMVVASGPGSKTGEFGIYLSDTGRVTANFTGYSDGRPVYGTFVVDVSATNPSCSNPVVSANPNPVGANLPVAISYSGTNCSVPDAKLTITRRTDNPATNNTVAFGPVDFGTVTTITIPGLAAGSYTATVAGNGGQLRGEVILTVNAVTPPTNQCTAGVTAVTTNARPFGNFVFRINAGNGVRILGAKFKIQRPDDSFAKDETTKAGEIEFVYSLFSKPGNWIVTPEIQTDCGTLTGAPITVGIQDETGRVPLPLCPVAVTLYRGGTAQRLVGFPSQTPQGYTRVVPYADESGKPYEDFRIDVEVPFGTPALTSQSLFLTGGKFPILLRNENPRITGVTSFAIGSLSFVTDGRNPSNGTFAPILVEGNLKIEVGDRTDCRGGELDPFQFYVSDGRPNDEKRPRYVVQFGSFTPGTQVDTSDTNAFPNRGRVGDEFTVARVNGTTIESSLDLVKVQLPSGQVIELKANANGFFSARGFLPGRYKVYGWDHAGVELSTEFWLN